jgi:hypothetical protein
LSEIDACSGTLGIGTESGASCGGGGLRIDASGIGDIGGSGAYVRNGDALDVGAPLIGLFGISVISVLEVDASDTGSGTSGIDNGSSASGIGGSGIDALGTGRGASEIGVSCGALEIDTGGACVGCGWVSAATL